MICLPNVTPRDSHGGQALGEARPAATLHIALNLLLQCGCRKSLHNSLCWLRGHLNLLAEHHPGACLCGWLHSSLDAEEVWHSEDTVLLHLSGSNSDERIKHFTADLWLQFVFSCNGGCQVALCHGLAAVASLHRLWGLHRLHRLHSLHGCHSAERRG